MESMCLKDHLHGRLNSANTVAVCFYGVIQTEAERRRREAGDKQSMKILLRSCGWVLCMYVIVCMVFGIIS